MAGKSAISKSDMWNWSTTDLHKEERFERFHAVNNQMQCLWDLTREKADQPFQASMEIVQVGDYALSRALTGPLTGTRKRSHIDADGRDFFSLMYQAEGTMVFGQRENESLVRPNYIAFWDSAQPAKTHFETPIRQLHLIIPRAAAQACLPGVERLSGLAIDGNTQSGRILRSHLLQLAESITSVPTDLRPLIMDATMQLIAATFHPDEASLGRATRRPALLRIEKYILGNLGDPDLSVVSIAEALGYTPRHVHRIFDGFDFSVSDWIRKRRLMAARSALASTSPANVSIAQIAYRCGFREQSHFSRAFKAEFGLSPIQFRRSAQSQEEPCDQGIDQRPMEWDLH